MMSHFNAILNILERDDSVTHFLGAGYSFAGRKDMLQDLRDTFAERSRKAVKYEMWI